MKQLSKVISAPTIFLFLLTSSLYISYQNTDLQTNQNITSRNSKTAPPTQNNLQADEILKWKIFGHTRANNINDFEKLPETEINAALLATFNTETPTLSSAYISVDGKGYQRYRIGDDIENFGTIAGIGKLSIIIETKKGKEKLYFPDENRRPSTQQHLTKNTPKSNNNEATVEKKGNKAFRHMGLSAVPGPGANGYVVGEKAKELKEKYDLEDGDIILSINGYPLGDQDSDVLAFESFNYMDSADITIARDGQQFTVSATK